MNNCNVGCRGLRGPKMQCAGTESRTSQRSVGKTGKVLQRGWNVNFTWDFVHVEADTHALDRSNRVSNGTALV